VEPGETLEHAVLREALEESDLECDVIRYLGRGARQYWDPETGAPATAERHFFELRPTSPPPERWSWIEEHASDGSGPMRFEFEWLTVAEAADLLDFGFGDRLGDLDLELAETVNAERSAAEIVSRGYDRLAETYVAWSRSIDETNVRHAHIDVVLSRGVSGTALDLGCGTGDLATAYLLDRGLDVIGLDISAASVAIASARYPRARFMTADMSAVSFPFRYFDLVAAFNSIIHLPRRQHARVFRDVQRWLKPGGVFVLNVERDGASGAGCIEPWIDDVLMHWAAWPSTTSRELLRDAGFTVEETDFHDKESFLWLLCTKPEASMS